MIINTIQGRKKDDDGQKLIVKKTTIQLSELTTVTKTSGYYGTLTSGFTPTTYTYTQGSDSFIGYDEKITDQDVSIYTDETTGHHQTFSTSRWRCYSPTSSRAGVLYQFPKGLFTSSVPMHVEVSWYLTGVRYSTTYNRLYIWSSTSKFSYTAQLPTFSFDISGQSIRNLSGFLPYNGASSYVQNLVMNITSVTPLSPFPHPITVTMTDLSANTTYFFIDEFDNKVSLPFTTTSTTYVFTLTPPHLNSKLTLGYNYNSYPPVGSYTTWPYYLTPVPNTYNYTLQMSNEPT